MLPCSIKSAFPAVKICLALLYFYHLKEQSPPLDIRHPEELSLLRKPRDPKKKKKKLEEAEEDDLELEGPLLTPGSGELYRQLLDF